MSILIFIIILAVLIFVHELGHFITAKKAGIRVDEFGIGFPPKILTLFKMGETSYTLNLIPFGGFVKIFGENPDDESISGPDKSRSFVNKPKSIQILVLAAGVLFNIIFAWLLLSSGFIFGIPAPAGYSDTVAIENPKLLITGVSQGSPASSAQLKSGDEILSLSTGKVTLEKLSPESVKEFIVNHDTEELTLNYRRGNIESEVLLTPASGILGNQRAIGISMDIVGILKLPLHLALWEGARTTYAITKATTIGLGMFVYQAFMGNSDLSQITGPVGIVGIVGDITQLGFIYLVSFTALISINLAVINLIPFPALDGGRILFVIIEAIKGSRINPKVANTLNSIGFALLIVLMIVVTYNDIFNLIGH